MGRPKPNGEHRDPVLDLVIVPSTKYPEQLSLRCTDDLVDGAQVTSRLNIVGFKAGDRVQLRRVVRRRPEWAIALWDAINAYVKACGGDPSAATVSEERERAVTYIEELTTGEGTR